MEVLPDHRTLYAAFVEAGIPLPDEITHMELRAADDGVVQLFITCNLTGPMLHRLGTAMQVLAVKNRLT